MDADTIATIVEADEFRTLTILDVLRADVKKSGSTLVKPTVLFLLLKHRINGPPGAVPGKAGWKGKPSEEVILATIQLLVELLHSGVDNNATKSSSSTATATLAGIAPVSTEDVCTGVLSVLPSLLQYMPRDRVRRGCVVLVSAALKRGGAAAGATVADALLANGFSAADETVRRACFLLCADLYRPGAQEGLPTEALMVGAAAHTRDSSLAVSAAAEKALGRMRTVAQLTPSSTVRPASVGASAPSTTGITSLVASNTPGLTIAGQGLTPVASTKSLNGPEATSGSSKNLLAEAALPSRSTLGSPSELLISSARTLLESGGKPQTFVIGTPFSSRPHTPLQIVADNVAQVMETPVKAPPPKTAGFGGGRITEMKEAMVISTMNERTTTREVDVLSKLQSSIEASSSRQVTPQAKSYEIHRSNSEPITSAPLPLLASLSAGLPITPLKEQQWEQNTSDQGEPEPIRGKLDLLKRRTSRQAPRTRRALSAAPAGQTPGGPSPLWPATELDLSTNNEPEAFDPKTPKFVSKSRLGSHSAAPALQSLQFSDEPKQVQQLDAASHSSWYRPAEPSGEPTSASTVSMLGAEHDEAKLPYSGARNARRPPNGYVASAGAASYGGSIASSMSSGYDAAAIDAEFGTDPYAYCPPSPAKDDPTNFVSNGYGHGSAPTGGRTQALDRDPDGRRWPSSASKAASVGIADFSRLRPSVMQAPPAEGAGVNAGERPFRSFGSRSAGPVRARSRAASGGVVLPSIPSGDNPETADGVAPTIETNLGSPYPSNGRPPSLSLSYLNGNGDLSSAGSVRSVRAAARLSSRPEAVDEGSVDESAGRLPAVALSPDVYTPSSQLTPLTINPDTALRTAVANVSTDSWEKQFDGLNTFRRLAWHHPAVLISSGQLHNVTAAVLLLADSLRSQLAKNATMTLVDLYVCLGRAMDPESEAAAAVLLKRSADTAEFISSAADAALAAMVLSGGEARTVCALLAASQHKSTSIRLRASVWIARAVDRIGSRLSGFPRELEKVIQAASKYVTEGNPDVRYAGQRTLLRLLSCGLVDERSLARGLPETVFMRVKGILEKASPPADSLSLDVAVASVVEGTGPAMTPAAFSVDSAFPPETRDRSRPRLSGIPPQPTPPAPRSITGASVTSSRGSSQGRRDAEDVSYGRRQSRETSAGIRAVQSGPDDSFETVEATASTGDFSPPASVPKASGRATMRGFSAPPPPEVADAFTALRKRLDSSDWKERVAALNDLGATLNPESPLMVVYGVQLADEVAGKIGDPNSKVALAALQTSNRLLSVITPDTFDRAAPLLFKPLVAALCSSVRQVVDAAKGTMDRMVYAGQPASIIQPIVTSIRHGNVKVRGYLLEKLGACLPDAYAAKPIIVARFVPPLIFEMLDDAKPDIKAPIASLIAHLSACMGADALLEAANAVLSAAGGTSSALSEAGYEKLRRLLGRR